MNRPASIRIGTGSAWWGDRIDPLEKHVNEGDLDYLCFEAIGEATLSTAHVRKRKDASFKGFDPYLEERMRAVLPRCMARGTRIVSNQGWINPLGAAEFVVVLLRELGYAGVKVAAVTGSDVYMHISSADPVVLETGKSLSEHGRTLVGADAYLGAEPLVAALAAGAQIVITGRVADPSLFLAPMIHAFGWDCLDATLVGAGSGIGHLLECGAQVTGGYYADPGFKDVADPYDLAYPIAEVFPDGSAVITKVAGSGGEVTVRTVKEQMFYEVHDPRRYITPDVVVDFTAAVLVQEAADRVHVSGITGTPRTDTLKVSIGIEEGFMGEDMLVFAGPGCLQRAELARKILLRRFETVRLVASDSTVDLLGVNAIHGPATAAAPGAAGEVLEVAVRAAARTESRAEAEKVGREIDGMAVSGVGYSGKRMATYDRVREVIGIYSALIPRDSVNPETDFLES